MRILPGLIIALAFAVSCGKEIDTVNGKKSKKLFKDLPAQVSGIDFSNDLRENDSLNYLTFAQIYMGGGVAAGDVNNDGLVDLYFTGNMVPNRLYLNKGGLKFEDISESADVAGDGRWFSGVTMADVNSDGFLDIYCSVGGKFGPQENLLFLNNGDLTFTEKAADYGIADAGNSVQANFFDYDLDGDLDLYVANYPPTSFDAPNNFFAYKMQNASDMETDRLFRNDGAVFTDVTEAANARSFGLTNSATIADLNQDGWPDIYLSNDYKLPDYLLINNRDGTFSEVLQQAVFHTALYGTGVDIADINNDQLPDILQVDIAPYENRRSKTNAGALNPDQFWGMINAGFGYQYVQNQLQLNRGNLLDSLPVFSSISYLSGVATTDRSWGPLIMDLDNDGWKDLFISNGIRRETSNKDYFNQLSKERLTRDKLLEKSLGIPSERTDNFVFRNNGNLSFDRVNEEWGLVFEGWSNGCAYADLDNDGDLEIIVNNVDDKASVFVNTSSENNNYLAFAFLGPRKNPSGLGVKVFVESNDMKQFQEMTLTRGYRSSVAPLLHFGLGKATMADKVTILWPDGSWQVLPELRVNQRVTVDYYESSKRDAPGKVPVQKQLFTTVTDPKVIASHKHIENIHDDFKDQVLLPHRTSTLGPGISVGDLNGDGLDDFVVGGAHNNQTGVFFQTEHGFDKQDIKAIAYDSDYEDLGSLIFDADGDGDNDLYVVSGGNEFSPGSDLLQDRLYVNDGKGNFERSVTALPEIRISGSRVKAQDYDKDGDLDLFVGGRLVPGNYPLPAGSLILENISEHGVAAFRDATADIAPDLLELGMVTDASWTDFDNDGWVDLLVVGEWMPIRAFRNKRGSFEEVTEKLGLKNSGGWWFSIREGDFDADGDTDFLVGNLGLNHRYRASEEKPLDVYVNDFDKNGVNDIALGHTHNGEKFPVQDRQTSALQIPAIRAKFKDDEAFSQATLADVYTQKDLEKSLHYEIRSFASVYLENRDGEFVQHRLPPLAQVSNINQILVGDFNGDSHLDAVIAGNLYGSEVETPRSDAGIGLFLSGDGKGGFTAVPSWQSGLYIPGDTKDLARITIKGQVYMIAAKNDDLIQFVKAHRGAR